MSDTKSTKQKWPIILGIVSLVYTLLYAFMFLRPNENTRPVVYIWSMVIVVLLVVGTIGLFIRKSWATRAMQIASWLVIAETVRAVVLVLAFMGGPPPVFVALGMLTFMLPVVAWPVFMLVWLSLHKMQHTH